MSNVRHEAATEHAIPCEDTKALAEGSRQFHSSEVAWPSDEKGSSARISSDIPGSLKLYALKVRISNGDTFHGRTCPTMLYL